MKQAEEKSLVPFISNKHFFFLVIVVVDFVSLNNSDTIFA